MLQVYIPQDKKLQVSSPFLVCWTSLHVKLDSNNKKYLQVMLSTFGPSMIGQWISRVLGVDASKLSTMPVMLVTEMQGFLQM